MTRMINFGIDLGKSNSLVAKFDKGNVEVSRIQTGSRKRYPA